MTTRAPSNHRPQAVATSNPPLCIAGIGASAGGFEAIRDFLHAMPADSGVAFIVLQHLAPDHVSLAANLFSKFTPMEVNEARDGMLIEANHVYTSPSDKDLTVADGRIHLHARMGPRRTRLPIDHFFESLGNDCATRAIGIIFSGTGSDGALGLKVISEHGGIVLVQKPETATFDGMPRSAIATGLATHVLQVSEMPMVITQYAHHPYVASVEGAETAESKSVDLKQVIQFIQERRSYDFSGYKRGTMLRRTSRRMGLHGLSSQAQYVSYLKEHPNEVDALFRDLLIGVTEFFRDPEAWKALETSVIGPIVASKPSDSPIRIWVPGCSTGEEAYTLAMIVLDRVRRAHKFCPVQIFATDTNNEALEIGRLGKYPSGIATRVAPERLRRYFTEGPELQHYVVNDELRKAVVFGTQNLFADPPFGRVDLISCRNVLIYLEPEVQRRILNIFHFALRPEAYLFLGSAESNGARDDLFKPLSKKFRIYKREGATRVEVLPPPLPTVEARPDGVTRTDAAVPTLSMVANVAQLLIMDRFAPAAVMVNDNRDALYFCGPTDEFLMRPRGAPTNDLLLMVRQGLRARLRAALKEASEKDLPVTAEGVRMKRDGAYFSVTITVVSSRSVDKSRLRLVVFRYDTKPDCINPEKSDCAALVDHLEEELQATQADLQSTIVQFETSTENLRISSEEVVSTNEELRSLNEELESSKEELQSLNEELLTVNQQLEGKVHELEAANSDLENLLSSSDIATICLDQSLRIKWFTPATQKKFNFIAADTGRHIADMVAAIGDSGLVEVAKSVLARKTIVDYELQTDSGHWFLRRVLPYLDAEQKVSGVILTYTDITDTYLAKQAARQSRMSFEETVANRDQLRLISMAMVTAEERERRALAQDLHDDLGQLVAIVALKIATVEKQTLSPAVKGMVSECTKAIDQVHRKLRSMALQLSPPMLESMGVAASMKWLADEVYGLYNLQVTIKDDGSEKPLDPAVHTTMFRAVRELLANVAKHARVNAADVSIRSENGDFMILSVSDSGVGFNPDKAMSSSATGGFGLLSLRERLKFLGGEVMVRSVPGDGTTVDLKIPLQKAATKADQEKTEVQS